MDFKEQMEHYKGIVENTSAGMNALRQGMEKEEERLKKESSELIKAQDLIVKKLEKNAQDLLNYAEKVQAAINDLKEEKNPDSN